jgi:uncharacterized damage-inducible protein DinB
MWHTPDRDRPLKVFCYHILADPNHVLDAVATGKYDGSFKLTYAEAAEHYGDMEEVARFGETTRARVQAAHKDVSKDELDRTIQSYAGETNGHELLYSVVSHTAHHLRQLYQMLRSLGIEPADPIGEECFRGISMPKELW